MKKLSIEEFKLFCNELSPKEFIVSAGSLHSDISENGLMYTLTFPRMIITSNPNIISFLDKNNHYMQFSRVKYIKQQEDSLLGKVFSIICTGFVDEGKEYSYNVIIR